MYKLLIDDKVVKDLRKIDRVWRVKILAAIKTKLIECLHLGKKLVGDLSPYYRLRVGDYRVLYEAIGNEVTVIVAKVKHRKMCMTDHYAGSVLELRPPLPVLSRWRGLSKIKDNGVRVRSRIVNRSSWMGSSKYGGRKHICEMKRSLKFIFG